MLMFGAMHSDRRQEGQMMRYVSTLMRIQSAFEEAGIRFLDNEAEGGIGVRLREQKKG